MLARGPSAAMGLYAIFGRLAAAVAVATPPLAGRHLAVVRDV